MALDIDYLKSAVFPKDFPAPNRPEIALAGRSNAGKSSFLNSVSKKPIAKVSQAPGKTRLLNFFDVGKSYRIVDMPGYGFAKRSGDEVVSWTEMIEGYLDSRENLVGLILIMDIRRDWTQDEEMLVQYLRDRDLPCCVVGTKSDQLSKSELKMRLQKLKDKAGVEGVFAVSNLTKVGTDEVEEFVFAEWVKPYKSRPKS